MAMSKEQILKGIERAEAALSKGTLTEGAKANLMKQVTQMKADLAALEKETEKKEEIIEKKEQEATEGLDAEIAKCEAVLRKNPKGAIKEVFEKKLQMAKQKKAELAKEAKEDKAEAKQELKEVKEAVQEITKAVATGRTEPIKKPKIEEKKRADRSKKRVAAIQTAITSLQSLVDKNKELKDLYSGRRVDLKRDAGRPAKPPGYRFVGKDYRVPTPKQIKDGLKRGTIDYEARPNRSDVYPAGYKGNIREKLADGGDVGMMATAKSYWNRFDKEKRVEFLISAGYSKSVAKDLSSESWDSLEKGVHNKLKAVLMADGGVMAKGGRVYKDPRAKLPVYEIWGKQDLESIYDNNFDLIADVVDYYKNLSSSVGQDYASEMKAEMIKVLQTGKHTFNDNSTITFKDGGKTESHSDQMIDIMNKDRESKREKIKYEAIDFHNAAVAPKKKKREKYTWDAEEDKLTGEREGERKAGMDEFADGGEIRKIKGNNLMDQIENGRKFKELIQKVYDEQKGEHKYPLNFITAIARGKEAIVKSDGKNYVKGYNARGTMSHFEFLNDPNFIKALEYVERPAIRKFEEGGQTDINVGNRRVLDKNKNGRLDKEDFQIIRGEKKMAKGGQVYLSVDDSEPTTLESFLKANAGDDVEGLTQEEIDSVKNLKIGEVVSVGMVDVKRVAGKKMTKKPSKKEKGGKLRKNSPHRFCWTKEAVKDKIIKPEQLKDTPSKFMRKKYPAYIMEK